MRAQVSVEFIIVLALLLILFLSLVSSVHTRRTAVRLYNTEASAKQVAVSLAESAQRIYLMGNNTQETFDMPAQLSGDFNYTITLVHHLVVVRWSGFMFTLPSVYQFNVSSIPTGQLISLSNNNGVIGVG